MPPIPSDFTDLPMVSSKRCIRTRLLFSDESVATKPVQLAPFPLFYDEDANAITSNDTAHSCAPVQTEKRHLDNDNTTPVVKRRRMSFDSTDATNISAPEVEVGQSPLSNIIKAVERLSTESDLVADGSRDNVLPTVTGKHRDLQAISPETMSDVLSGKYKASLGQVTIIDCRYPYEYQGGHIKGAVNLYTKDEIQKLLNETLTSPSSNHVLIFHCEFSSERGPKMYRHLRSLDRELNQDHYPRLNFPEIYLLEGGYKAFFENHMDHCFPKAYKPMLHKEHSEDLRHFRVKSKSWAAGDKPRHRSRITNAMKLRF